MERHAIMYYRSAESILAKSSSGGENMNEWMNYLSGVVNTGDDANPEKWIWILVAVGVILVIMAVVSVVISKKRNAEADSTPEKNEDK